jgi:hypothetical protein
MMAAASAACCFAAAFSGSAHRVGLCVISQNRKQKLTFSEIVDQIEV